MASVKAMVVELSREIERHQLDAFGIPPEGHAHRRIEEERRRVEERNASIRREMQEETMKLKWGIVACEVVGFIRSAEF